MNPPQQRHLDVIARLRRGANVGLSARQQVEGAQQILAREAGDQGSQPIALAFAGDFRIAQPGRVDPQQQQIANDPRQFTADESQVVTHLDGATDQRKRRGRILVRYRFDRVEDQIATDQTKHGRHIVHRNGASSERDDLVQLALSVAHASFRISSDQLQSIVADDNLFCVGNSPKLFGHRLRGNRAELVHLRP